MLFFIKSKCITFIAQKTRIIHWFETKNPTNTSQTDIKSYFVLWLRGCTIFSGKKPCCKSLTAGSPSCRSNVNCKLQTRPQDRRHVTFCGLRFSMKNLKLKVSNRSHFTGQLFVPTRKDIREIWTATAIAQNWNKSFRHIKYLAGAVGREGLVT